MEIYIICLASLDLVRNVQLIAPIDSASQLVSDVKTVGYHITWKEPLTPNGLVYFYTVHIDQYTHNGPKDERCVGHTIHSINISLLPKTNYRLRIVTYTIARLNHEYEKDKQPGEDLYLSNTSNLYYQLFFKSISLPGKMKDVNGGRTTSLMFFR